jgi:protein PsiE
MQGKISHYNKQALALVEHAGLLVIAIATVIAAGSEVLSMINNGRVGLADLLLLFIYLEVLTMVGLYYGSGKLPVRFPLYIGMVALARYLVLDMKAMDEWRMLAVTGAILILAIAVLIIRYGHTRYPYPTDDASAEMRQVNGPKNN